MAISRRTILQLAMAPALRPHPRATAQDLEPTTSRVYPGPAGGWPTCPTSKAIPFTTPLTPAIAAAASRFPPCRCAKSSGRSAATTRATSRQRSTRCRRVRPTPPDSAAPCSSEPVTTGSSRHWHSRQRHRAARRGHGRHRYGSDRHRYGTARRRTRRRRTRRRPAGRVDRRSGSASGVTALTVGADDHRRLRASRLPHLRSRPRKASDRATRSSCDGSATRHGSTPSG